MSLTRDEIEIVNKLGAAATLFERLPVAHEADLGEFVLHTHALQNIVMSRAAQRAHPDQFPSSLEAG